MSGKKEILIIANGESILKNDYGDFIDKHPLVARINNYQTKGFEKQIGRKTDIWFNGANSKLKLQTAKYSNIIVLMPSQIILKKQSDLNGHVSKRLKLDKEHYTTVPLSDIQYFENQVGYNRLTTGLYSILWAVKNYNEVIIHGFDFFQDSKAHYYDNSFSKLLIKNNIIKKGQKHNNILEKEFVNGLIGENKIKTLKNIHG